MTPIRFKEDVMALVKVIGDISIYANSNFVSITVDDKSVLFIPRSGHGLSELAKSLTELDKD